MLRMARNLAFIIVIALAAQASAQQVNLGCPVNLSFQDEDLGKVLEKFATEYGMNYVVSAQILEDAPKVTAQIKNIPLHEAISGIAMACGLYCEITESGLVVLYLPEGGEEED